MSDHHHHHGPHGHHHHGPSNHNRAFAIGVALNMAFVVAEAGAGLSINSLALLADAGHNLGDVAGLLLAWGAAWAAGRRATPNRTYGLGRTTILASLANGVLLMGAVGALGWEAIQRMAHPEPVADGLVMLVAGLGILVNGGTAALFLAGRKEDLNIRGAFLHMVADAVVSLGVVVAAFVMGRTGWLWLDPAASLVVVAVIVVGTWGLLRESLDLALDAVPATIDRPVVEAYLVGLDGVAGLHDLHIWPLSTTSVALTVHLVAPNGGFDDGALHRIAAELHDRFGIDHATIQVERGGGETDCRLARAHGCSV
jgi:cobalt-zinc-cadmium efflux system protein